jgi:hypothetical protein
MQVKDTFYRFTATTLEEMQANAEDDELLQGVDWGGVEGCTDFKTQLDTTLPGVWGATHIPPPSVQHTSVTAHST